MIELVRVATSDDVEALALLEGVARQALVDERGGRVLLEEVTATGDWHVRLSDEGVTVFVALLDEEVFGYLELVCSEDVCAVRQVYVDPEARELGLGDELLGQALAHARSLGAVRLDAFALPGDRQTKNLYERAGVTARKIIVSKVL